MAAKDILDSLIGNIALPPPLSRPTPVKQTTPKPDKAARKRAKAAKRLHAYVSEREQSTPYPYREIETNEYSDYASRLLPFYPSTIDSLEINMLRRTPRAGLVVVEPDVIGVAAQQSISSDDFIAELCGRVCLQYECSNRDLVPGSLNDQTFLFQLGSNKLIIDARECGNFSRNIRRSCSPNANLSVITSGSRFVTYSEDLHVVVTATEYIKELAEITIAFDDDWKDQPRPDMGCACRRKDCELERYFREKNETGRLRRLSINDRLQVQFGLPSSSASLPPVAASTPAPPYSQAGLHGSESLPTMVIENHSSAPLPPVAASTPVPPFQPALYGWIGSNDELPRMAMENGSSAPLPFGAVSTPAPHYSQTGMKDPRLEGWIEQIGSDGTILRMPKERDGTTSSSAVGKKTPEKTPIVYDIDDEPYNEELPTITERPHAPHVVATTPARLTEVASSSSLPVTTAESLSTKLMRELRTSLHLAKTSIIDELKNEFLATHSSSAHTVPIIAARPTPVASSSSLQVSTPSKNVKTPSKALTMEEYFKRKEIGESGGKKKEEGGGKKKKEGEGKKKEEGEGKKLLKDKAVLSGKRRTGEAEAGAARAAAAAAASSSIDRPPTKTCTPLSPPSSKRLAAADGKKKIGEAKADTRVGCLGHIITFEEYKNLPKAAVPFISSKKNEKEEEKENTIAHSSVGASLVNRRSSSGGRRPPATPAAAANEKKQGIIGRMKKEKGEGKEEKQSIGAGQRKAEGEIEIAATLNRKTIDNSERWKEEERRSGIEKEAEGNENRGSSAEGRPLATPAAPPMEENQGMNDGMEKEKGEDMEEPAEENHLSSGTGKEETGEIEVVEVVLSAAASSPIQPAPTKRSAVDEEKKEKEKETGSTAPSSISIEEKKENEKNSSLPTESSLHHTEERGVSPFTMEELMARYDMKSKMMRPPISKFEALPSKGVKCNFCGAYTHNFSVTPSNGILRDDLLRRVRGRTEKETGLITLLRNSKKRAFICDAHVQHTNSGQVKKRRVEESQDEIIDVEGLDDAPGPSWK